MEMFVSPDGKMLCVHDEKLAAIALESITLESGRKERYLIASQERLQAFGAVYDTTVSILQEQGFDVQRLPGIFEADGDEDCLLHEWDFCPLP